MSAVCRAGRARRSPASRGRAQVEIPLSHESRIPARSIRSWLSRLLLARSGGELTTDQETQIFIRKAAENLTELVDDLLTSQGRGRQDGCRCSPFVASLFALRGVRGRCWSARGCGWCSRIRTISIAGLNEGESVADAQLHLQRDQVHQAARWHLAAADPSPTR